MSGVRRLSAWCQTAAVGGGLRRNDWVPRVACRGAGRRDEARPLRGQRVVALALGHPVVPAKDEADKAEEQATEW